MTQTDFEQSATTTRIGPGKALILSAVVLPGLGQLLTGRKIKGAIMAGSMTLWLPVALIKLFMDLGKAMPELSRRAAMGESLQLADLQAAMQPMAGGLVWVFLPLVVIWFWTVSDSVIYLLQNRRKRGDR